MYMPGRFMLKHCKRPSISTFAFIAMLSMTAAMYGSSALAASLVCESIVLNEQEAEALCTLPATTATKAARFKAHFLGSHDDSVVSLKFAALDGTRVACAAGSKTESRFEDGEVTLDCGFAVAPANTSSRRLKVAIALHHLQLDRTVLLLD